MLNFCQSYWSQSRIALQLRLLLHQNDAALAQQRCSEAFKNHIVAVMFFKVLRSCIILLRLRLHVKNFYAAPAPTELYIKWFSMIAIVDNVNRRSLNLIQFVTFFQNLSMFSIEIGAEAVGAASHCG
jgi:hypothetical protein